MEAVLAGFRDCWPAVGYRILDSRYFGVAQRRRRVFFVCGPDEAHVASVLFESEGGVGNSTPGGEEGACGAASLASSSHGAGVNEPGRRAEDDVNLVVATLNSGGNAGGFRTEPGEHVVARPLVGTMFKGHDPDTDTLIGQCHGTNVGPMGALRKGDGSVTSGVPFLAGPVGGGAFGTGRRTEDDPNLVTHALSAEGADASEDGTGRGTPMVVSFAENQRGEVRMSEIALQLTTGGGKPGEGYPAIAFTERTRKDGRTLEAQDELAYALTNPGSGGRTHSRQLLDAQMSVRRLTPTECARLQGFPDGWCCLCQPLEAWAVDPEGAAERCTCPDSPQYRAYGNAVTVTVVEWIGRRLLVAMRTVT